MFKRRTVPSRVSARVRALSLTVIAAPLLLCCASAASAKRTKQPPPPTEVVELELRELGDTERAREFIVPLDGKIAGEVTLFDESGRCELRSRLQAEERVHLELRCSNPQLELDCTRALVVDAPTIVGEIEVREGRRMRILATRR